MTFCVQHKIHTLKQKSMPKAPKIHNNTKLRIYDEIYNEVASEKRQQYPICAIEGCKRRAYWSTVIGDGPYCAAHRTFDSFRTGTTLCGSPNCIKRATWGPSRHGLPVFCKEHRQPGSVISKGRLCNEPGCQEKAIWRAHHRLASKCDKHHSKDMIKNIHICRHDGCLEPATEVQIGWKRYCDAHSGERLPMRNKCLYPGCNAFPNYGLHKVRLYCGKHRTPEMGPEIGKECQYPGCQRYRIYGWPGTRRIFCIDHKLKGMQRCKKYV